MKSIIHEHAEIVAPAAPVVQACRFFDQQEHRLFRLAYEAALNHFTSLLSLPHLFELAFEAAAMDLTAEFVDSDWMDRASFYVRGVVSPILAAIAIANQGYREELPEEFRYVWLRMNPDPSENYSHFVAAGTPRQRGSFRATILDPDGIWKHAPSVEGVDAYACAQDVRRGYPKDATAAWVEFRGRYVQ